MRTLLGILAALVLALPAYSAEKKDAPKEKRAQAKMERGDRMMRGLNLTPEQRERLKDFRKKNMEEMKPLRRELEDQITALRRMVQDNAAESKIARQLEAIKRSGEKVRRAAEKHKAALEDILTPVQRAKFLLRSGGRTAACAGCPMAQRQTGDKRRQWEKQRKQK